MAKSSAAKCNTSSLPATKKRSTSDECIKFVAIKIIVLVVIDDQTRLARLVFCGILKVYWALSSVGRAPASHAGGRRFKSGRVHFNRHQKQGVLQSTFDCNTPYFLDHHLFIFIKVTVCYFNECTKLFLLLVTRC